MILTSFGQTERVKAALEAGASGFLLKDAEPDELIAAVRAARRGEMHIDSSVTRQLTRSMLSPGTTAGRLSAREMDVLRLVAEGRSNREIANLLTISERTARTHVSNVLGKLGLSSGPRPRCGPSARDWPHQVGQVWITGGW